MQKTRPTTVAMPPRSVIQRIEWRRANAKRSDDLHRSDDDEHDAEERPGVPEVDLDRDVEDLPDRERPKLRRLHGADDNSRNGCLPSAAEEPPGEAAPHQPRLALDRAEHRRHLGLAGHGRRGPGDERLPRPEAAEERETGDD